MREGTRGYNELTGYCLPVANSKPFRENPQVLT